MTKNRSDNSIRFFKDWKKPPEMMISRGLANIKGFRHCL
ncbi:hypothetical protein NT04LM_0867 [Listeria monocytogenes FSL F2-208]|nr:hypothetical protein NT04LM_0867 [Listeria monocytogenes FSL F2-208]